MATKDPSPVAILAARLQRAYPALSPYSAASLAEDLAKIERAQRRHAERCCSGADGGCSPSTRLRRIFRQLENWRGTLCDRITRQSPNDGAKVELLHDPRGPVLKIRLPGETDATSV